MADPIRPPSPRSAVPSHAGASRQDLESTLRDVVRNSPYVAISLLLHGLVLIVLMAMKEPVVQPDETRAIVASAPTDVEAVVLPPEVEPDPEQPDLPVEEPTISELSPSLDPVALADAVADAPFDSNKALDVLGVGPGVGGEFGRRGSKVTGRKSSGRPHQKQIEDALTWLKHHQHADGFWSCEGFSDECGKLGPGTCSGRGSVHHDVGVTGLALLAFLGAGETDRGRHGETVKNALRFLRDVQEPDGRFGSARISTHSYDHVIATLAVTEAWALTGRSVYKRMAERGVKALLDLRNPGRAWRYIDRADPDMQLNPDDVSVTGWAILALTMAKDAGLEVDPVALDDALMFIDEMTDELGRTGYYDRGGSSSRPAGGAAAFAAEDTEAMTAVGVLSRLFIDPDLLRTDLDNAGDVERGVRLILARPIVWDQERLPGRIDYYSWYAASYALFQWGGQPWRDWEAGILEIARHQLQEGDGKGSWDPQPDVWGAEGGRVYSTALLTLVMEVYSRYPSVLGSRGRR